MKKLVVILFLAAGTYSTSFAQDAGQMIIGGGFGFGTEKAKVKTDGQTISGDPVVTFKFSPRFGYFLSEDMEIGARLGFRTEATGSGDTRFATNTFSFGPYVRKYIGLGENVLAYGQGSIGFGSTKVKAGSVSAKTHGNFSIGITPGVLYRLGDNLALDFGVGFFGYRNTTVPDGADETQFNSFGLDIDLGSLNFGLTYFL